MFLVGNPQVWLVNHGKSIDFLEIVPPFAQVQPSIVSLLRPAHPLSHFHGILHVPAVVVLHRAAVHVRLQHVAGPPNIVPVHLHDVTRPQPTAWRGNGDPVIMEEFSKELPWVGWESCRKHVFFPRDFPFSQVLDLGSMTDNGRIFQGTSWGDSGFSIVSPLWGSCQFPLNILNQSNESQLT